MTNIDYNYSDPDHSLPLSQPWEKVAMKDLCDIAHYLAHGLFVNAQDYSDRLRNSADEMDSQQSDPTIGMSPVISVVLGVHLNAVAIAAKKLGVPIGYLWEQGQWQMSQQTPEELEALCNAAIAQVKPPENRLLDLEHWLTPPEETRFNEAAIEDLQMSITPPEESE